MKISEKHFNVDLIHGLGACSRGIDALQIFENTKQTKKKKIQKMDYKQDFPEMKWKLNTRNNFFLW